MEKPMTAAPAMLRALLFLVPAAVLAFAAGAILWLPAAFGAEPGGVALPVEALNWGFAAAALATGASSIAAGYAVAAVGSAGVGALAEKPELMGRVLVLVGLAEGIAIYGLIVSILILNRLG